MHLKVGNRLRNANEWDKEHRDYRDKTMAKQKDLDGAQQQHGDLEDQAPKLGGTPGRARVTKPPAQLLCFHQFSQAPNLAEVMAPMHAMKSSPLVRRQRT
jgi:hypothetical protein